VAPLVTALRVYDNTILRLGASGQTAMDIRIVVVANAKLESVLAKASAQTPLSSTAWSLKATAALRASRSADNVVRHDLGLPVASTF
jgi:hypothetical protein